MFLKDQLYHQLFLWDGMTSFQECDEPRFAHQLVQAAIDKMINLTPIGIYDSTTDLTAKVSQSLVHCKPSVITI